MELLNERTRRDLEFDKVLALIGVQATSAAGQAAVARLRPFAELEGILAELDRVQACMEAIGQRGFAVPRVDEVGPTLDQADQATTVAPEELWAVLQALEAIRRLRGSLEALEGSLGELARRLEVFPELEGFIRRSVDEQGQIRPDASPALRQLTRRRQAAEQRARKKLAALLSSAAASGVLQEAVITSRAGRLVVPVKSHLRHQLSGIVQDSSGSGQTLYLEPTSVVAENNLIRELEGEIRDEKLRILQALTAKLRAEAPTLRKTLETYAWIDSLAARARYALGANAVRPELNTQGFIRLRQARHPLLDPGRVVPIDLSLGEVHRGVVITGPNTGGKTVALKTVGLLTLMAQAAIPIPAAEGSALAVFAQVRSDIGDEQSIEQNLSTFSSHLRNIVSLLHDVRVRSRTGGLSLVILDEVGAGTDPQEGTALAVALLRTLLELETRLLVTTHYGALKRFAYRQKELKNASVEFDLDSLSPTYRLLEGVPGASNAFLIAERLGVPADVIAGAQAALGQGEVRAEDVIRQLQAERAALDQERQGFYEAKRRLEVQVEQYRRRLSRLEAERERALGGEIQRLSAELQQVRGALERALHAARQGHNEGALREELKGVRAAGERLAQAHQALELRTHREPLRSLEALGPGRWVRVRGFRKPARVLSLKDEAHIQVEIDGVRLWTKLSDLSAAEEEPPAPVEVRLKSRPSVSIPSPPLELDVRGKTAAEAIREVDHYMNQLLLAERSEGAILHGKGTGALRRAIRDHLKTLRWIKDLSPAPPSQGGDGVTVVELG